MASGVGLILILALQGTACSPLRLADVHTTSMPTPPAVDVAGLARDPVAVLGVVAPPGLQGFGPVLSHALDAALARTSPPIGSVPAHETINALNAHGLATRYADLLAGFARSGVFDKQGLARVGAAVGCRYLLVPGLTQLDDLLADRFEAAGLKIVRNRVFTLRLWLQLWDATAGRIVWESSGEATTSSVVVFVANAVPLDAMAEMLWTRMIREGLLSDRRLLGRRRVARTR